MFRKKEGLPATDPEIIALKSDILALRSEIDALRSDVTKLGQQTSAVHATAIALAMNNGVYMGNQTVVTRLQSGHLIFADSQSTDVGIHLIMGGVWEVESTSLFQSLIKPGDTVLDVGANQGVYSILASAASGPTGKVHAFEPNPRLAHLTKRSLLVNGFWQSQVHTVALSDAEGTAELFMDPDFSAGASMFPRATESVRIPIRTTTLDSLLPNVHVDVLKMDVEGYEGVVFKGMSNMLTRSSSLKMLIEWSPEMMAGTSMPAAATAALLQSYGFKAFRIDGGLEAADWQSLMDTDIKLQNIYLDRTS